MIPQIEKEIEALKMKKVSIVNKMNRISSPDEREEYAKDLEIIQRQIDLLERMR